MFSIGATMGTAMPSDHFQPEAAISPQEQRKIRGSLEHIDVAAFEANRQTIGRDIGRIDINTFKKLATNAATARAQWVAAATSLCEREHAPTEAEIVHLGSLRAAYVELSEAYEAMRRMVERGYICFLDHPPR